MNRRSLLVTMICTLSIACAMTYTPAMAKLGTGSGAGTGNAGPGGVSASRVEGLSASDGGVKRPKGGFGRTNNVVVAVVVDSRLANSGHGGGKENGRISAQRVAGISSAQNGGVGTGSGTGTANLTFFTSQAGATGQGSGSSVGK